MPSRNNRVLNGLISEARLIVGVISLSHFINHFYLMLLPPIFSLLVVEYDVGLTGVGFAVSVLSFFGVLFQLPFGYLSDNYGRTLTLGIGFSLSAVGIFLFAFAPSYEWLLISQAVLGTGIASHHPAHYPLLSASTSETSRGRAYSIHGFAGNIGMASAPALITAILAVPYFTWRSAMMIIGAISIAFAAVIILSLKYMVSDEVTTPSSSSDQAAPSISTARKRLREYVTSPINIISSTVRDLFSSPAVIAVAVLALVTAIANWGLRSYSVVLLTDGYGVSLGLANTVLTLMFVAGAVIILAGGELTDRLTAKVVLIASFAITTVAAFLVSSLTLLPILAMTLIVLAGGFLLMGSPARDKLVDNLSLQGDLGKNFAIITIGIQMGGTVAPPLFGAIIDTLGLQIAFLAICGFTVLGILVVLAIVYAYGGSRSDASSIKASGD